MAEQDERPDRPTEPSRRFTMVEARWAAAGAIALLFGIFIAQNTNQVEVGFVFFNAEVRLIWVFLICGVVGGIIDRLLQRKGILSRPQRRARD